ncbi:TRAP transporter small permease [Paracoccus alkanivorans]|uniref:TRAP transporter small permease protein n=1 Tax=Paracoccus alkanivorans TaxID=2116655 RepID=A0A3M0M110_9RHOB|nr:TRAP transporter small permease [Paracoccus alkanivorans]RMC30813.1 TRAP transporter small permease [Paracoccus alkanivorans]
MTAEQLRAGMRTVTAVLLGVLLIALTAVTVVDVAGRYLFNSPLSGGTELTELLVMAVVFAGLPAITLDDGHVTADLLTQHFSPTGKEWQLFCARILSAAALALGAWQLWQHGLRLASYNQTTLYLKIPMGPVAQFAAVICAASAVMVLAMALLRVRRAD